ncbi:Six-bladed beta-propeller, TolB-like,Major royal jelly protein/protein yellow [Cinara cedri]|uniref:Six-bladed beta-propeller, TolB-like,Major royal jelly protein/protein yellow n=1 Tax=Cinara cedri TaxID=506608 RepID=A0A5E4MVU6_9HEMI|nr:Six-bladed beta-propeller, TolB-like,Major royal jelly protein/protein yellow [Cinara cedri]
MSGFSAVALAMAAAAATMMVRAQREVSCPAAAAYTLSGQNLEWPCASTKTAFADTGRYVAKNIIATRVQVWADRAFVLTPRFRSGVPFTVSAVRLDCRDRCWPVLSPYPCWSVHEDGGPSAVRNAVDMYLDPKGVLWLLDDGLVNTVEQPARRTQPKILAVDVKTDKVVMRIDLSSLVCAASRLNYITTDYGDDGRAFVYVSDAATRAVIVWDVTAGRGYRVVMPKALTHGCTGRRDVLYIALAQRPSGTGNVLYLTYLTSSRMYAIDTCNLRQGCSTGVVSDLGPKPEKMVVLGTDGRTTLYFRYRGQGDVYAWDTDRDGGDGTVGACDADRFALVRKADDCGRLATHVTPGHRGDVLWILESNFPDYVSGTVGCLGANVRLQPLVDRCGGAGE